jgi:DNA-directed RNA polymerase specialized sigma24 family protein
MSGEKPADVAASLTISVNAVYVAKSAVLRRLRQEMEGLAD